MVRQPSLRSKLSLPNLLRKQSRQDETASIASSVQGVDGETVQVQDMDFELVRPNIAQLQSARASVDSGFVGGEMGGGGGYLRAESPAVSMSSGQRSPSASDVSVGWGRAGKASDSETGMDAHRQRELKWVSLMSSVPAGQSRRNKRVKKLLMDGVPSSVRYLVWAHLTDGKGRGVPGVYVQLGNRGRVPAFRDIERDVRGCFVEHPQMLSMQGPVLSLLQAYLTMVPDIQYTRGEKCDFLLWWVLG